LESDELDKGHIKYLKGTSLNAIEITNGKFYWMKDRFEEKEKQLKTLKTE
jgi:hypothetical protein